MKQTVTAMEKENPIDEARRYVENAKKILKENGELDTSTNQYGDRKYVRMAGNTLWNGMLVLLEAVFKVKAGKTKGRPDIIDYRKAIGDRNRKLLDVVNGAYDTMHLYMGYDGTLSKKVCDGAFEYAALVIGICAKMI